MNEYRHITRCATYKKNSPGTILRVRVVSKNEECESDTVKFIQTSITT